MVGPSPTLNPLGCQRYRIIRDRWAGFEVQRWYWWPFPWWYEIDQSGIGRGTNTFRTLGEAEQAAAEHAKAQLPYYYTFPPKNS